MTDLGRGVLLLFPLVLFGCGSGLPPLAPSGEPLGVNPHVTSVRIDPRTLKPIEEPKERKKEQEGKKEPKAPEEEAPK